MSPPQPDKRQVQLQAADEKRVLRREGTAACVAEDIEGELAMDQASGEAGCHAYGVRRRRVVY